jgi:Zinc finger, C2H2 type/C2H2-type zinc finger
MSYFKELLKVEIVKQENEDQKYDNSNDLVEYVTEAHEDAEFEAYEYIVEEITEQTNHNNKFVLSSCIEGTSSISCNGNPDPSSSLTIKLQSDKHYQNIRERKYICSNRKCKKEEICFESQHELDQHNWQHRNQILLNECPICNKILISQAKLNFHMETRHIPKNFQCDNCGKVFRSKDNLRLHMSHHRKHFKVECRACKKSYKSIQSLRYHLRQHFEHHQCESCGQVR